MSHLCFLDMVTFIQPYVPVTLPYYKLLSLVLSQKFLIFLCKWLSIRDSFLVKDGSLCPLPHLSAGILSGLNLCRFCSCCHNLCLHVSHSAHFSAVGPCICSHLLQKESSLMMAEQDTFLWV